MATPPPGSRATCGSGCRRGDIVPGIEDSPGCHARRVRNLVVLAMLLVQATIACAGFAEGERAFGQGDYSTARRELEPAAAQGDPAARSLLGSMYLEGRGVLKDERRGVELIRGAAEAGDAHAQFLFGTLHAAGRGVQQSDEEAARWFERAAIQGHPTAQGRLGVLLARGDGVSRNEEEAIVWWRRGADQGDGDSQGLLGIAYYDGAGVAKDRRQAYFWLLLASARAGDAGFRYRRFVDRLEAQLRLDDRTSMQQAAGEWRATVKMTLPPGVSTAAGGEVRRQAAAKLSTGSGILIAPARVLTNHHVTQGCQRVRVGGATDAQVIGGDAQADLALLEWVPPSGMSPVSVRLADANVGEAATVAGYPLSGILGFNVTTGNVSSLSGLRGDRRLIQISAPVQPGNSGGPLLDAGGNMIGVVVSKLDALRVAQATGDVPQNVNFAINAGVVASFLKANGLAFRVAPAWPAPIPPQDAARLAQSFTVLVECWR